MKLYDLPPEILLEIASYIYLEYPEVSYDIEKNKHLHQKRINTLDFRDSLQTRSTTELINFALACRKLYFSLSSLLWESVHLERSPIHNKPDILTKCDPNMHRRWSIGLSSYFSIYAGPVRTVNTLSWNMLQNVRIFSACKTTSGVIHNVPVINNNLGSYNVKEISYGSWTNLVNPTIMPVLSRLEICLLPSNSFYIKKHTDFLRESLLTRYNGKVRLAFRVQLNKVTISTLLEDFGLEVMLLVQSVVICNTNTSGSIVLSKSSISAIQYMKNLEHLAFESAFFAKSSRHFNILNNIGNHSHGGSRTWTPKKSSLAAAERLMNVIKDFKSLRQLELPMWRDCCCQISKEMLERNHFTELMCSLSHLQELNFHHPIRGSIAENYPLFESLQSLEIFLDEQYTPLIHNNSQTLNPATTTTHNTNNNNNQISAFSHDTFPLKFHNLQRLLCFSNVPSHPAMTHLIRDNAKTLRVVRVNEPNMEDLIYLLNFSDNTLQTLFIDEFQEEYLLGYNEKRMENGEVRNSGPISKDKREEIRKNFLNFYSLLKYQRQLQRLVLPVMKCSSNLKIVQKYITMECLQIPEVWFASCQKLPRKMILCINKEDEDGDGEGEEDYDDIASTNSSYSTFSASAFGNGFGAYALLQVSLYQHLSDRYIKGVSSPLVPGTTRKQDMINGSRFDGGDDNGILINRGNGLDSVSNGSGRNTTSPTTTTNTPVTTVTPKIRHLPRYNAPFNVYRCDLLQWRKDLKDDYSTKMFKKIAVDMFKINRSQYIG